MVFIKIIKTLVKKYRLNIVIKEIVPIVKVVTVDINMTLKKMNVSLLKKNLNL